MTVDRSKALESAISAIEKSFGRGSIMRLGSTNKIAPVEHFSSGSLNLDIALGIGGYPKGRIIEVFGPESSGKTTLALQAIASIQREGGVAAFVDVEHALDPNYAAQLGVDTESLLISQPDAGEDALEIVDTLIRSGAVDFVVVDSVAALVPKAELSGEMGDAHVGLQARLMSQALRKITGSVSKTKCSVLFINQIRMKIGVMFGNPETTAGGNALKFYSSVRLDIRRVSALKEKDEVIGQVSRVKVIKNKVAPPHRQFEADLLYGKGIWRPGEILDLGVHYKIVEKSGAWYSYNSERIGQGAVNSKNFLSEHPEMMEEIEGKIREAVAATSAVQQSAPTKESDSRQDASMLDLISE